MSTARLDGQAVDAESTHDEHVAVVAVALGGCGAEEAWRVGKWVGIVRIDGWIDSCVVRNPASRNCLGCELCVARDTQLPIHSSIHPF